MSETPSLALIADELAVRRVLDEYCLRMELDTFDHWLDLFTEDTVYEVFRRKLEGKAAMAAMLSQAPHGLHLGGPARITLDGDRAEAIQNYIFVSTDTDEWNMGWYNRTLVRVGQGRGQEWKIAHTAVKLGRSGTLPADGAKRMPFPVSFDAA